MDVLTIVTMGFLLPATLLATLVVGRPQLHRRPSLGTAPVVAPPRSHVRVVSDEPVAPVVDLDDRRRHRDLLRVSQPA